MQLDWKLTWQRKAEARVVEGKDASKIPGLSIIDSKVSGPWDAVSTYLQRPGPFKLPTEAMLEQVPRVGGNTEGLREFQVIGIRYILDRWETIGSVLLADDMGLGKTAQTIRAADEVGGTRLVVAPRTVIETWKNEIKKWSKNLSVRNIKTREQAGTYGNRMNPAMHSWVLISYDLLAYLATGFRPTTLIIDEAHNFAGRTAKRGKKLKHFAALAENRIALTGTPIWSRPRDFWMLFKILFGSTFGGQFDFDEAYCGGKINEYGGMDNKGATNPKELKHRVAFYMLRRLKRDVAKELPAVTRTVRWVDPVQSATSAMKKAFLHRSKGDYYRALAASADAKLEAAMEAATDARDFLLVTGTRAHARYMHQELNKRDVPCELITGEVSPRLREVLMRKAAKKKHGVVATIDVCREGVDGYQHVTSNGIMHTLDFVPNKILQYEGRLNRIGQTLPVSITYILMRESMDAWVNETVVNKLDQWKSVIDETGEGLNNTMKGKAANQSDEDLEKEVLRQIYRSFKP